jgi:hypothetical protein
MGVDRTDLIMYGWKMPYDLKDNQGNKINLHDDKFESVLCGFPGEEFLLVTDGMCGSYNVFGQCILQCDDDGDGWDFVNLDFNLQTEKVKENYTKLFNMIPETEPTLFIFSHYS